MQVLRKAMPQLPRITTAHVKAAPHGRTISIAGMAIVRQRPPTAKGTVFSTLEDESGLIDLVLHSDVHKKYEEIFSNHAFLIARGSVQRDRHSVSLLVKSLSPVWRDPLEAVPRLDHHFEWQY
jgi:error-prone DNA polymerase